MSFHAINNLPPEDQLLFNQYGRGSSAKLAHTTTTSAFAAIAAAHPHAIALRECFGSERFMTYADLDQHSNIVANILIEQYGVRRGHRVVCVFSRHIEMCAFIFGVMKAGAQYVPIDGDVMVEEGLRHVIGDSQAQVVLCMPNFRDKVLASLPEGSTTNIASVGALDPIWQTGNSRRPSVEIDPSDGAYVIYTSGTTGKPKGVDVSHLGSCNTLLNEPARLGITVGTKVASLLMLGFDMCAWEILATLMNGGTLHLRAKSKPGGDKDAWAACLRSVDVVINTPSGAQKYFPRQSEFPNIKTIVVGGEPCPLSLADEWAPHVNFWNACGPTEISITNTAHLHQVGTPLSIGKPNPNTNVYVLDENMEPVRIGEVGLMWVGGLGVSRGYVNLPHLTAERYQLDKFTMDGKMMFNTGDLGRWQKGGSLEHMGRIDDQVKVKGVRVELDGISRCLEEFPEMDKACVLKMGDELWGFYSTKKGPVDEADLRSHLSSCLNFYARPRKLIYVANMPMTAGGKIDKKQLREIGTDKQHEAAVILGSPNRSPCPSETDVGTSLHSDDDEKKLKIISTSSLELEKEETVLPPKNGYHGQRWLRHKGLSAYRKLFLLIFTVNLVVFIVLLVQSSGNGLKPTHLSTAVASNLLASVLMRQDNVVNTAFWLATRWPTSAPFWIRRHAARVYHIGGIHSSAAICATLWWIVFTVQSGIYMANGDETYSINPATMGLTAIILAFLLAILAMAYPTVRAKMHDQFEWTHRFAGWTALALVWAQTVVAAASLNPHQPLGKTLAASPAFWLLFLITASIAWPWTRLRRVEVTPEPLSKHAVRLHFGFDTPPPGRGVRITHSPMREWHAFATITEPGSGGFSIIVSRAGDWTGACIDNPPTRIWTRGVPASGVLRIAPLFRKIVLVATGSGIGPCLPVILAQKVPCRVFWSTPNPEERYGQNIIDAIKQAEPKCVIWNTKERGRPNMALEAYKLYKESDAECVCIISNNALTTKLVYDLESRGIPAFGPIWDS